MDKRKRNQEKDKLIELLQNDIHTLKRQCECYQSQIKHLDNMLKDRLEDKDAIIKNLEAKLKNLKEQSTAKDRIIQRQFKTIANQSKDLKCKDRIIKQLRKEKEDDQDIQLTEVIRESSNMQE